MLNQIIYYVDLFIYLQAWYDAYDLAITAYINGYRDEELIDQILYLRGVINEQTQEETR